MNIKKVLIWSLLTILFPINSALAGKNDVLITEVHVVADVAGTAVGLEILGDNLCQADTSGVTIPSLPHAFSHVSCTTLGDLDLIEATLNVILSDTSYLLIVDASKKNKHNKTSKRSGKSVDFSSSKIDEFEFTYGVIGEQGEEGPEGVPGDQGAQGDQGPQGDQGLQGNQGSRGNQGSQGDLGPIGPQGPTGGGCTVTDHGDGTATLSCSDGTSVLIPTLLVDTDDSFACASRPDLWQPVDSTTPKSKTGAGDWVWTSSREFTTVAEADLNRTLYTGDVFFGVPTTASLDGTGFVSTLEFAMEGCGVEDFQNNEWQHIGGIGGFNGVCIARSSLPSPSLVRRLVMDAEACYDYTNFVNNGGPGGPDAPAPGGRF